jgi:hypothetical protein
MLMTTIDISYLHDLSLLIARRSLPIIDRCPECDEIMPTEYLDLCKWSERHGVIDMRDEGMIHAIPTLVIGCEGYHLIDSMGREKDHSDC